MKSNKIVPIFIFVLIMVGFLVYGYVQWINDIKSEKIQIENTTSEESLFFARYEQKNLNYEYNTIENYYFVAVSKQSLLDRVYVNDIFHLKEVNGEFEIHYLENGLEASMSHDYTGIPLGIKTEDAYINYITCFIYEDNDYYIMYLVDTNEIIKSAEDNYNDFKVIESPDYDINYYFNVIQKEKVTEDYEVKFTMKDIGMMTFGKSEILEAFNPN